MITIETLKDLAKHDPDIASWAAFLAVALTGDNQDDKLMDVIGGNVMFPETREEAEEIFQQWDMDGHELLSNNSGSPKRIMYAITNNSGGPTFVFLPHVWDSKFQRYVDELDSGSPSVSTSGSPTIPEEDILNEVGNYLLENDYHD